MDPWIIAVLAMIGAGIAGTAGWMARRWRGRPPSTALAQLAQLKQLHPDCADCRLMSALVDAGYDQLRARRALADTEEWRRIWDDFGGDCQPPDIDHVSDIVRELGPTDQRWNDELGMTVGGRYVALDMVEWERVGSATATVSDVARATMCAVERGVRRGDGVAFALRPSMSMIGDGRNVLEKVMETMKTRYGGTLVSVWAAPCNLAVRVAIAAAKQIVAPHTQIFVLSEDDVSCSTVDGRALSEDEERMVAELLGLPVRQV